MGIGNDRALPSKRIRIGNDRALPSGILGNDGALPSKRIWFTTVEREPS
jgi:hypothetical protein